MEQLIQLATGFGAPGIIALACGWYVIRHDDACNKAHEVIRLEHATERETWRVMVERIHGEAQDSAVRMTEVLAKNAQALAELSTLLRDRN